MQLLLGIGTAVVIYHSRLAIRKIFLGLPLWFGLFLVTILVQLALAAIVWSANHWPYIRRRFQLFATELVSGLKLVFYGDPSRPYTSFDISGVPTMVGLVWIGSLYWIWSLCATCQRLASALSVILLFTGVSSWLVYVGLTAKQLFTVGARLPSIELLRIEAAIGLAINVFAMPVALAGGGGGGGKEEAIAAPLTRVAKKRPSLFPRRMVQNPLGINPRLRSTSMVPGRQHISPNLRQMLTLIGSNKVEDVNWPLLYSEIYHSSRRINEHLNEGSSDAIAKSFIVANEVLQYRGNAVKRPAELLL